MTCSYTWTPQCVVKTFAGFVSGDDFVMTAESVAADARFETLRVIYNDFLAVEGHSIDARCYTRVAASRAGSALTNPNFRVAFVASGSTAEELAAAIAGADQCAVYHPHVCTSMEEGRSWFAQQPSLNAPRYRT